MVYLSDAAAAKSLQLCQTLRDPIDRSPAGSPVPEIFQTRILEWVAISSSNASKWKVKVKSLSHVRLVTTPWTAAYQAPLQLTVSNPGPPVGPWLCLFMQCLTYSPLQTSRHCLPSCLKQETGPERDAPAQHFTASKGITSLRVLQLPLIEFKWAKEFITT